MKSLLTYKIKKSWPYLSIWGRLGTLLKGISAVLWRCPPLSTYASNWGLNQEPCAPCSIFLLGSSPEVSLAAAYLMEAPHKARATTFYRHRCWPSVSASTDQSLLDKKTKSKRSGGTNTYGVAVARKEEIILQGSRRRLGRGGGGMMLVMRGRAGSGGRRYRENEDWMWKNRACSWIKRGWRWWHNYFNS